MIDLKEKLSPSIHVQFQIEANGLEYLHTIEHRMGIKIPQWYLNFLSTYGSVHCEFLLDRGGSRSLCVFDLRELDGFIDDYYKNFLGEVQGFLPIGNDLGDRVFFYTEQWGQPGIYLSAYWPASEYQDYIAPDLQHLLFNDECITRYMNI